MSQWTDPLTVTAAMSALAAGLAAFATWRAPLSAARIADELRKAGDQVADQRRFKLNVFAILMQERSELYSIESVRALNSIDIAFSDSISVREAWAELYQAFGDSAAPPHVVDERVRKLLREIAVDLGIADKLRLDDFGRVYVPKALAEERSVRDMRRKKELETFIGIQGKVEEQADFASKWPPAPE